MSIEYLALSWYVLIGFVIIMYVLLDGYDLGIGILSIFFNKEADRDIMVSVIMPVWDGNGTWLVFGGASLYGAFPLAFSVILPSVYAPLIIMVVSLLLRGISLEFRLKAYHTKLWDIVFFGGSLIATVCQALVLSAFIVGFTDASGSIVPRAWANPITFASIPGLIVGYMLLGSNRLIAKTAGNIQGRFFKSSKIIQYLLVLTMCIAAILSPYADKTLIDKWWGSSTRIYFLGLFLLALWVFILHIKALNNRSEKKPFIFSVILFLISFTGLVLSSFPYLVPHSITFISAIAPKSSLNFMFWGAFVGVPFLLFYTGYAYYTFRGKVKEPLGY
ncbi:MAG: cytochrome d ubiquinol oxidase subunit II [Proteobacteria bacterium]|jgi:cytochrome d ubiquinol oxidase subunit II|nr:cytochrome d ubiquinol oxidase subunit II [Pseudomonadota bacterium]